VGDVDDVEAALAAAFPEVPDQGELPRRRAAEQRSVAPVDGRKARYIGRSKQLNVKVRPELFDRVKAASERHALPVTYMAEQAFEMLLASLGRKAKGGD